MLALLAGFAADAPSDRASLREASSRSRAASPPAARSSPASPTSPRRPASRSRSSTAASTRKSYIIEVVGCGVAFLDYDNDGWLDLLVLNGTRLEGAPAGHDEPPLQEQPRRHVHRRDREGGARPHGLGLGGHRGRLRQRRLRRPVHHLLRPERALPQQRQRHVHGRDREGRPSPGRRALRRRLHLGGLRPRRAARPVRRQLPRHDAGEAAPAGRKPGLHAGGASP